MLTILGIGDLTAMATVTAGPNPKGFQSGRKMSVKLGVVPPLIRLKAIPFFANSKQNISILK